MPNHIMSCFKCSKKLTNNIDKQARSFFWGSDMKCAPVAWEEVCQPKSTGGLGIRPSAYFNNAAIAKLAWKVINDQDNWWSQIMRRKYLRKVSFFQAKKKQKNSIAWSGVLDARDLIMKGMRWIIGNGKNIKFWTFNWAFDCHLLHLIPDNKRNMINLEESVAESIINGKWDKAKLAFVLDPNIVKQILSIPLPVCEQEDEYIWGPSSNGKFSIKSATWLQYDHLRKHSQSKLINKLWKLNVQPKIKIFGWLLLRGRLKTRDRLSRFGIINDNSCLLCNRDNETADHLFGYCEFTKEVWRLANINTPVD
ncbi:putative reverse transcriptase zinc-binding domain-containing protein [Rosa chinensis]|uniref:Putative reverse transcriptase zinc-binding domain-containing protein n=1 Tax=Rosa chinensis TaxID=74649 RepID=A0A2P6QTU5_ROSCH|nr:putative reverse transcriptase zinc-binding domain-containing protein [Rosa chinensis]